MCVCGCVYVHSIEDADIGIMDGPYCHQISVIYEKYEETPQGTAFYLLTLPLPFRRQSRKKIH